MRVPASNLAVFAAVFAPLAGAANDSAWPQWRGPNTNGVAPQGDPPIEWSESKNVKWRVEIPGTGSSTPVAWGDRLYVLTAVPTGEARVPIPSPPPPPAQAAPGAGGGQRQGRPRGTEPDSALRFTILSIDRATGKTAWSRVLREELPHESRHPTGSWASASAITDGERVYAFFGSRGLYALDLGGKVLWEKDLGDMKIKLGFGEGASPALHAGRLVVTWDHEGESFIVALDSKTGRELWRAARDEKTSWSTPLIVEHGGRVQVVTSATGRVRSYDLATGELVWHMTGMTENVIPTPVHADGVVYLTSGYRGNALAAVRLAGAKGDITGSPAIAWTFDRDTPYVPSPLLYGDELYVIKNLNGILSCFDAKTGTRHYGEQRIEGVPNVYASPVGAAGRVYIAGREGSVAVVQRGPQYKLLAVNTLADGFDASPVVLGDDLYLRGKKYLYRISRD